MKKFKFMILALVAICGLNSCSEDCDHNFIEYDYNKALVGTWTCLQNGYAEALVISADGSAVSTGVEDGEYWEGVKGNIKTINNKMTMTFEDGDNWEGRFEILSGEAFTIFEENGESFTYNYCANDLSDEIVGMWMCNDASISMRIHSFDDNGNALFTGWDAVLDDYSVLEDSKYRVVGDLIFQGATNEENASSQYIVAKLVYTPNGTAFGDIMSFKHYLFEGIETVQSWLRIKQGLAFDNQTYDYNSAYVTNAKGTDEDFIILDHTFNIANIEGGNFDMLFRSELFCVDLNANQSNNVSAIMVGI